MQVLSETLAAMLLVQTIRVPAEGLDALRRFEAAVLPLLSNYGARLERRLRTPDGCVEVHVVSFPSREALDRYRADPTRQEHLHLLHDSLAASDVIEVTDVTDETGS
jgi:hypothetical protein